MVPPEKQQLLSEEEQQQAHDAATGSPDGPSETPVGRQASINRQETLVRKPSAAKRTGLASDTSLSKVSSTVVDPAHQSQHAAHKNNEKTKNDVNNEQGACAAVSPEDVDVEYLQDLIDKELGPPKFSVPKQTAKEPEAPISGSQSSLQELLEKELGPPKFAVQKPSEANQPKQPAAVVTSAPHIRLEVIAGPAKGKVHDTTDTHHEVMSF